MTDCFVESKDYVMNTYGRFPLVISHGDGVYVYDKNGKAYLDMCAGIAVNALGYKHPKLTAALKEQIDKLCHISNLYYVEPQLDAAKLLVENSSFSKVFFCNSGAEANEAALKLARKYGGNISPDKTKVISMKQSFHGRTYGALTATGQSHYQESFHPLVPGFLYGEYNNLESVQELMDDSVCAVILEVIQGEGGIIPGTTAFLKGVEALCQEYDALLIVDEVQTGIGRCGSLFAHELYNLKPDVVTMAKGLGGGVPIGGMMCTDRADVFVPGDHATTFGGNPLATTAATVVLEEVVAGDLLVHVENVSDFFFQELLKLQSECPEIVAVRGKGLMLGVEFSVPVKPIVGKCMENGMMVVGAGEKVLRFVPPLIISNEEVAAGIEILKKSI